MLEGSYNKFYICSHFLLLRTAMKTKSHSLQAFLAVLGEPLTARSMKASMLSSLLIPSPEHALLSTSSHPPLLSTVRF